jgi:Tfp pilus assembly protein PilO
MNYLEKLAKLDWPKVALGTFLMGALGYFGLYDDGTAATASLQAAQGQVKEAQALLKKTEIAVADAERFQQKIKVTSAQFKALTEFMPADAGIADIIEIAQREASAAGVRVIRIEPKDKTERILFYETRQIELQLSGTFAQLVLFLSNISKVPRLLTFEKMSLTGSGQTSESPNLDFVASMVTYRYVGEENKAGTPASPEANANAAK